MQTIAGVFHSVARGFNAGDTISAAGPLITPLPIYIGKKLVLADTIAKVASILDVYRENLTKRDYAKTQCAIIDQQITLKGAVKVEVEWTNKARNGDVINTVMGTYYCRKTQGHWMIELLSFAPPQDPKLLDGVVLH